MSTNDKNSTINNNDGISLVEGTTTQRHESGFHNSPIAITKRQLENYSNEKMYITANFNNNSQD